MFHKKVDSICDVDSEGTELKMPKLTVETMFIWGYDLRKIREHLDLLEMDLLEKQKGKTCKI